MSASPAPEVALRTELRYWRGGATVVLACVLLGCGQAVLWSAIAPGEQFKVFKDGTFRPLPTESTHQYISMAIFSMISIVIAVAVALAVWSWRAVRGTVMLTAVGLGNALGALTGYLSGRVLVGGIDPSSIGPSAVESLVKAAPTLGSALIVVVQPAIAVVVYTFLVAWNGQPDLGRGDPRPNGSAASADAPGRSGWEPTWWPGEPSGHSFGRPEGGERIGDAQLGHREALQGRGPATESP